MHPPVLVVLHISHCPDRRGQRRIAHSRRADPEIIHHLRRYPDHAGGAAVRFCKDRHQVHAHGRLAGPLATVGGIHGGNPVEGFALPGRAGAGLRAGYRRGEHEVTGRRSRQRGQQGDHKVLGSRFHDDSPAAPAPLVAKK